MSSSPASPASPSTAAIEPILPPEHRRPESNTLLTYPEWHIVHAYEDYAEVIRQGDRTTTRYLPAIGQYWGSLCSLTRPRGHGRAPRPTTAP
jgi:hypothetical protein